MINSPLQHILKIPASMQRAEVRPEVVVGVPVLGICAECEDAYVALAHEVHPQRLDTMVDVAEQIFLPVRFGNVSMLEAFVVIFVHGLPYQVQAMKLVEDLNGGPVTLLTRLGVFDRERVLRQTESIQLFL